MVPLHFILQENAANAHCTCPGFQATAPLHLKDGFPAPSSLPHSHGRGGARPLVAQAVARVVAYPAGPVWGAGPRGCRAGVCCRHPGGAPVVARRRGRAPTTLARPPEHQQRVFAQPAATSGDSPPLLQLQVPLNNQGKFSGVVLGEYSIDSLLRYGTPTEVLARYAVTLLDGKNQVLAGTPLGPRNTATQLLPWSPRANEYEVPVSPVGNGLVLKAQAYRTSLGVVGSGLFWLVGTLSAMTAWMLIATWRSAS